jgi:carbon storage regulator
MLVLTRRLGETIVIDGDISIAVVGVKGDRIRLGITAPKDVPVDRQEVYERRSEWMDRSDQPERFLAPAQTESRRASHR